MQHRATPVGRTLAAPALIALAGSLAGAQTPQPFNDAQAWEGPSEFRARIWTSGSVVLRAAGGGTSSWDVKVLQGSFDGGGPVDDIYARLRHRVGTGAIVIHAALQNVSALPVGTSVEFTNSGGHGSEFDNVRLRYEATGENITGVIDVFVNHEEVRRYELDARLPYLAPALPTLGGEHEWVGGCGLLDFEALAQSNNLVNNIGYTHEEDGFRLSTNPNNPSPFAVFGDQEPRFAGSTALFNRTPNALTTLERIDGGDFGVVSMRLANLNDGGPARVNFVGTLPGGGTVNFNTDTADPAGLPNVFTTREFPAGDFMRLRKLEWTQLTPFHQFDGVVLSCPPEPPAGCYADCDTTSGRGVLDVFDFLCFQNAFAAGLPYACDCDTSSGVGVCDVFDFLCFQNAFDAGCP